jgi:putative acetyltransferase
MVHIRKATAADGKRVMEIWRAAVDATHHFLSPTDRRNIEAEVATFLPQAPLWLAVDDFDRPIGLMLLNEGHMEALFVDPLQRGFGVGRALVRHGLCIHPNLTTDVNEQNVQAVGFYEHLGFERVGRSEKDSQGRSYPLIHMRVSSARNSLA